ncbi:c-type cytochrome [Steroidobacter cummioxidans]|uniref:c-type cytochrome n=1 Tax=Steroidobacter cummioxidans TaxID=1803913 RepID=UPI0013794DC0|nr:cytochrome c [Steroidobacter cummioxidans]
MDMQRWRWGSLLIVVTAALPAWVSGSPSGSNGGASGGDSPPGAMAFARACAACHGASGEGDKAPPIVPLAYVEDQVAVVVRSGQGEMPPIPKAALSDAELAAIVTYLSQLKP